MKDESRGYPNKRVKLLETDSPSSWQVTRRDDVKDGSRGYPQPRFSDQTCSQGSSFADRWEPW